MGTPDFLKVLVASLAKVTLFAAAIVARVAPREDAQVNQGPVETVNRMGISV